MFKHNVFPTISPDDDIIYYYLRINTYKKDNQVYLREIIKEIPYTHLYDIVDYNVCPNYMICLLQNGNIIYYKDYNVTMMDKLYPKQLDLQNQNYHLKQITTISFGPPVGTLICGLDSSDDLHFYVINGLGEIKILDIFPKKSGITNISLYKKFPIHNNLSIIIDNKLHTFDFDCKCLTYVPMPYSIVSYIKLPFIEYLLTTNGDIICINNNIHNKVKLPSKPIKILSSHDVYAIMEDGTAIKFLYNPPTKYHTISIPDEQILDISYFHQDTVNKHIDCDNLTAIITQSNLNNKNYVYVHNGHSFIKLKQHFISSIRNPITKIKSANSYLS